MLPSDSVCDTNVRHREENVTWGILDFIWRFRCAQVFTELVLLFFTFLKMYIADSTESSCVLQADSVVQETITSGRLSTGNAQLALQSHFSNIDLKRHVNKDSADGKVWSGWKEKCVCQVE